MTPETISRVRFLRRHALQLLVAGIFFAAGGGLGASLVLTPKATASATLEIRPTNSTGSLAQASALVEPYARLAALPTIEAAAGTGAHITITTQASTPFLVVTAQATSADQAASDANAEGYAFVASGYATSTPGYTVVMVAPATPQDAAVSSRHSYLITTVVLFFLTGIAGSYGILRVWPQVRAVWRAAEGATGEWQIVRKPKEPKDKDKGVA